jgi:hypothetical protein
MPERKGSREERASFRGNEFDLATMRDEQRANDGTAHAGPAAVPARGEERIKGADARRSVTMPSADMIGAAPTRNSHYKARM